MYPAILWISEGFLVKTSGGCLKIGYLIPCIGFNPYFPVSKDYFGGHFPIDQLISHAPMDFPIGSPQYYMIYMDNQPIYWYLLIFTHDFSMICPFLLRATKSLDKWQPWTDLASRLLIQGEDLRVVAATCDRGQVDGMLIWSRWNNIGDFKRNYGNGMVQKSWKIHMFYLLPNVSILLYNSWKIWSFWWFLSTCLGILLSQYTN